jgi:hypothetical protein
MLRLVCLLLLLHQLELLSVPRYLLSALSQQHSGKIFVCHLSLKLFDCKKHSIFRRKNLIKIRIDHHKRDLDYFWRILKFALRLFALKLSFRPVRVESTYLRSCVSWFTLELDYSQLDSALTYS